MRPIIIAIVFHHRGDAMERMTVLINQMNLIAQRAALISFGELNITIGEKLL